LELIDLLEKIRSTLFLLLVWVLSQFNKWEQLGAKLNVIRTETPFRSKSTKGIEPTLLYSRSLSLSLSLSV